MKSLQDNVVLLTGAGGGFGRILTRRLLQEGCLLILASRRREAVNETAIEAAREAPDATGRVLGFVLADLSEPAGAEELYREAARINSKIDMLINNAGVAVVGRFDQIPRKRWEKLMQVNLLSPMRLTSLVLPQMISRRSGHIVNIASAAGLYGTNGFGPYSASKFGLYGFGEALANDLRGTGVNVTTVYPWFARTAILESKQYGYQKPRKLPERLIEDPEQVMAEVIQGIKQRRRHIFPSKLSRAVDLLRRIAPGLLGMIVRRIG
jgi:short-subunit dehydrogenase